MFGELKDQTRGENENYLDSEQRKGTKEEIETRIKEMLNQDNCKKYNLLSNNCEHLATYVRYGEMTSKQVCGLFNSMPSLFVTLVHSGKHIAHSHCAFNCFYIFNQILKDKAGSILYFSYCHHVNSVRVLDCEWIKGTIRWDLRSHSFPS